jgi:hypothetical protein
MRSFGLTHASGNFPLIAVAVLLLLSSARVMSQDTPAGNARRDREARESMERDMRNRQWNLRVLDKVARSQNLEAAKRQQMSALVQIKRDFEGMQASNNDILREIAAGHTLNLRVVSDALSEIKRQAVRLKSNLVLPEPERDERDKFSKAQLNPEQLKPLLLNLDGFIIKFIGNPIFRNTDVVDAKSAAVARLHLESIIELSDKIRKDIEKISRSSR